MHGEQLQPRGDVRRGDVLGEEVLALHTKRSYFTYLKRGGACSNNLAEMKHNQIIKLNLQREWLVGVELDEEHGLGVEARHRRRLVEGLHSIFNIKALKTYFVKQNLKLCPIT